MVKYLWRRGLVGAFLIVPLMVSCTGDDDAAPSPSEATPSSSATPTESTIALDSGVSTVPSSTAVEGLLGLVTADVPPFRATVSGIGSESGTWTAEVTYGGSGSGFRADYLAGTAELLRFPGWWLESPSDYVVTDGELVGWLEVRNGWFEYATAISYDPLRHLAWDRNPGFSWDSLCGRTDVEELGEERIAGLVAVGIRCVGLQDAWSLWIDPQSGLVLRLESTMRARDEWAWPEDFEIREVEFDPAIPPGTFDVVGPPEVPVNWIDHIDRPRDLDAETDGSLILTVDPSDLDMALPSDSLLLLGGGTLHLTGDEKPTLLLITGVEPKMVHPDRWNSYSVAMEALQQAQEAWGDQVNCVLVLTNFAVPELAAMIQESRGYNTPIALDTESSFFSTDTGVWMTAEAPPGWVLLDTNGLPLAAIPAVEDSITTTIDLLLGQFVGTAAVNG